MKIFKKMLLWEFLPFLFIGIVLFSTILILADIFANLWKYLNEDVPISQALKVSLLYGPMATIYALPIGALFAAAFAVGNLGAKNELIAVFGAGVKLLHFISPILVAAIIISVGSFFLEDRIAIPYMKQRHILSSELLGEDTQKNRDKVLAISQQGAVIYYADYYNDSEKLLVGVVIIERDSEYNFQKRIDAKNAKWNKEKEQWILYNTRVFSEGFNGEIVQETHSNYSDPLLNEHPDIFNLDTRVLEDMNRKEAAFWIEIQKKAGLPYKVHQAKLYQRYTIALTPFLVVLFAGALGGRFQRNILLMSLLASLGLSAAWYIVRMVSTLLSEMGHISPLSGAVVPYAMFLAFGLWLFKMART